MGPPEGAQLKLFDLDADGSVTRDEADRALHAQFAKYDIDKDSGLSAAEARALNDERRKQVNASPVFDWNADGRVDFKEYANQWLSLFDRLDANGDGMLTEQEMTRPQMGPPGGRRGGGPPGGGRRPPGGGR
jgi:Ca2+-binding EF-hand superfamily protein